MALLCCPFTTPIRGLEDIESALLTWLQTVLYRHFTIINLQTLQNHLQMYFKFLWARYTPLVLVEIFERKSQDLEADSQKWEFPT